MTCNDIIIIKSGPQNVTLWLHTCVQFAHVSCRLGENNNYWLQARQLVYMLTIHPPYILYGRENKCDFSLSLMCGTTSLVRGNAHLFK